MDQSKLQPAKDFLIKAYHDLRQKNAQRPFTPPRLIISKCKWLNNAASPVVFMIDDLTNAWFDKNNNNKIDIGEDWGAGKYQRHSILSFLEKNLLSPFHDLKITFFIVVGKMASFNTNSKFTFSGPIDHDNETIGFFKKLYQDERFELAYHGWNHGRPNNEARGFTQEWLLFSNLQEAVEQNNQGIELYKKVFGKNPNGGKYGGYQYNDFADQSIDACGFKWWCRDWFPEESYSPTSRPHFDLQYFGMNKVVDIPSNVHGFWWTKEQIHSLIRNKQIIAIQEHISPYRVDGKIQNPNVIHDIVQLKKLFGFLTKHNVWFATCSQVAEYFIAYNDSLIYDATKNSFRVKYWGNIDNPVISLLIDARCICSPQKPFIEITLPDRTVIGAKEPGNLKTDFSHLISLPLMDGEYEVTPVAAS